MKNQAQNLCFIGVLIFSQPSVLLSSTTDVNNLGFISSSSNGNTNTNARQDNIAISQSSARKSPRRLPKRRSSYQYTTSKTEEHVDEKETTSKEEEEMMTGMTGIDEVEGEGDDESLPTEINNFNYHNEFVAECNMPTELGNFLMRSYRYESPKQKLEPLVMLSPDIPLGTENVLVRVHDQCLTSEVFGSWRCDCKEQLQESLRTVQKEGGLVIYLQQEGRGIGISNKIAAYSLQDEGMDTVEANEHLGFKDELREYQSIPYILESMGIKSIRLRTNNPYKMNQLNGLGVNITERVPIEIRSNPFNRRYLTSKRDKMNHFLSEDSVLNDSDETPMSQSRFQFNSNRNPSPNVINSTLLCEGAGFKNTYEAYTEAAAVAASIDDYNDAVEAEKAEIAAQAQSSESEDSTSTDGCSEGDIGVMSVGSHENEIENKNIDDDKIHVQNTSYVFGKESVLAAIEAVRQGKVVIVVDDADRENEGDLIMAADKATPETIGFIVRYSSGVLCGSLDSARLEELELPPMVENNQDPKQTAYTISVDYKYGTTTGISAHDRALTFKKLADPSVGKEEFQRPGHVFPLRYKAGGVKVRGGHTEASLDLTALAGLNRGGVLAEVVNDDGSLMLLPGLEALAKKFDLVLTSVQDIIAYRTEFD